MNGSAAYGTAGAPGVTAQLLDRLDALPADAAALFDGAPFQSSPAWWRCTVEAALPAGAAPLFVLCREGARATALMPLQTAGRRLSALATPYTCLYQPLLAAGAGEGEIRRAGQAMGRALRGWPSLRLDALDPAWPGLSPLLAGLRAAGWRGYRFDAFGNWRQPLAGLGWEAYLAARPGALRETLRRKLRASGLALTIAREPAEAASGLAEYEDIHRRSWKQPEPFPRFNAALLRRAAEMGVLRLGVLRHGDAAVAAQYWVVSGGVATVLKLTHDEQARALSPGTLLTAMMIRRMMAEEDLAELDFGRGDDPYKQSWASMRRQRIGVMLANPWRPGGLAVLARRGAGQAVRWVQGRRERLACTDLARRG